MAESGKLDKLDGELNGTLTPDQQLTGFLTQPKAGTSTEKDYNKLDNKPQIEGNVLEGDKTFKELGLDIVTPQDIDEIIFGG